MSTQLRECWYILNKPEKNGYVRIAHKLAHRLFYETFKEDIPKELVIDHICNNKSCVNPQHLRAVTQRFNVLRSNTNLATINKNKTHCPKGHEYNNCNTRINKITNRRQCRLCARIHQKKYINKMRSA